MIFLLLLTLFPLLALLGHFQIPLLSELIENSEFIKVLLFTLVQGILSGALAVVIGLVAAPGYSQMGALKKIVRPLFIFPQMVSPVFVILGLLISWKNFPYGLWGVVIGHGFVNAGLCAIVLGERWATVNDQWSTLGKLYGASSGFYFRKVMWPQILPTIKTMFALVFSFAVSSLAIPLVLGGGPRATTLEVLIYEKIKTQGNVSMAVAIALIQFLLQFIVFLLFLKFFKKLKMGSKKSFRGNRPVIWPTMLTLFISIILFIPFVELGLSARPGDQTDLPGVILFSTVLALMTSLIVTLFVILWNTAGSKENMLKIPALSSVVIGLGFILIFSPSPLSNKPVLFLVLLLAHVTALTPLVLRFVGGPLMEVHRRFFPVLKLWGYSKVFNFKKVFWPLNHGTYILGFVLVFCWSMGEFSTSVMIAPSALTLPLHISSLMSQYRLEQAAFASLFLFITGFAASLVGDSFIDG